MIAANPNSINAADNHGIIPLHIASQVGKLSIVKFLIETNKESLSVSDLKGNSALHHACLQYNCGIVSFILTQTKNCEGASVRNSEGKLPIEILLYDSFWDRDSHEYIEAIYYFLCAHPYALIELMG